MIRQLLLCDGHFLQILELALPCRGIYGDTLTSALLGTTLEKPLVSLVELGPLWTLCLKICKIFLFRRLYFLNILGSVDLMTFPCMNEKEDRFINYWLILIIADAKRHLLPTICEERFKCLT